MTNYEKYKDEFIELLATEAVACDRIYCLRTNKKTCPQFPAPGFCEECETLNKQWLNEEVVLFDPAGLKPGDKIIMREYGGLEFYKFKVVCNSFPTLWLRFRGSENGMPQEGDDNFLISYDDLIEKCNVREVIRND